MLRRHCRKLGGGLPFVVDDEGTHLWPFGEEWARVGEKGVKRKPAQKNLFFGRAFLVRCVTDVHRHHA